MYKYINGIIICSVFLVLSNAQAETITYNIIWTGSGTYAFENESFTLSLIGDTTNVTSVNITSPHGAIINEPLTALLYGPFGTTPTYTNQYLGLQSPVSTAQSLVYGEAGSYTDIIDMTVPTALSTYDLISSTSLISLDDGHLYSLAYFQPWTFTDTRNFTFEAISNGDTAIAYNISWTGSGTYAFENESFLLSMTGDTLNATNSNVGIINEPLTSILNCSSGITQTYSNQYVGIQSPENPNASLVVGDSNGYTDIHVDMPVISALSSYDLISSIGPINFEEGTVVLDYSFFMGQSWSFNDISYFSFEAITTNNPPSAPVPEPTTILLLGTGLMALAGFRKRRKD